MRWALAAVLTIAVLGGAGTARAAGGDYVVDGGTAAEQAQVRAALDASSFPWGVVTQQVRIHVVRGGDSYSTPGEIWLDADLLDAGTFAWGTVQHEYAHQVDFFLLDDVERARLQALLGGRDWCYEQPALPHDAHGCERFADSLAAAYWDSPANTAHAFAPVAQLRAELQSALGLPSPQAPVRTVQSLRRSASCGSPSRPLPSACRRPASPSPSARASAPSRPR